MPQAQFIDSVFVSNRDRDSTGAALGQVVQEFRAVHRQGRRVPVVVQRRVPLQWGSTAACGIIPHIFNMSSLVLTTRVPVLPRLPTEAF